jgi:hypothetical protein
VASYLLLGGTGPVGRALASQLATNAGSQLYVASRNRVLLEEMSARLDCEPIHIDLAASDASPESLPRCDVLVDLTVASGGRHPRLVIRRAGRVVRLLTRYLQLYRQAHLCYTTTWAVLAKCSARENGLCTKLDWRNNYLLAKSAAERALANAWLPGRMRVVRLGNVVTPDSDWGVVLLRALRAGNVGNPESLGCAANLSTVAELTYHLTADAHPEVALATATAGWTWGEVLERASANLENGDANEFGDWARDASAQGCNEGGSSSSLASGLYRFSYLAPATIDAAPLESVPASRLILGPVRRLFGRGTVIPIQRFPPRLPNWSAMPGAQKDEAGLRDIASLLSRTFVERGYSYKSPDR